MTPTLRPLLKLFFAFDDEWHGYETESVWVEYVDTNRYRLRNSPFFARGVSAEDIVFGEYRDDSRIAFAGTSVAGGHSTYRIILQCERDGADFAKWWQLLRDEGCTYEEGPSSLIAIDVPPHADIHRVYALLERGEESGVWGFEEGHCGHEIGRGVASDSGDPSANH